MTIRSRSYLLARASILVFGAVLLALVSCAYAGAIGSDVPLFEGDSIPSPPMQREPWTLPAGGVPSKLATAAALLFSQGLSDPRGCEYRQVKLVAVDYWGGSSIVATRAWVLPQAKTTAGRRFAIAWNGLIYPLVSSGEPGDYRSDVRAAIKADANPKAKQARQDFRSDPQQPADPETHTVSAQALLPIRACLLLRLGDTELARKLWDEWNTFVPIGVLFTNGNMNSDPSAADPYMDLASDWARSKYERAVNAHERGDDHLSLIDLQELPRIDKDVAEACKQRGLDDGTNEPGDAENGKTSRPFLPFLSRMPMLLADQERRAAERAQGHKTVVSPGIDKLKETLNAQFKTPAERVAALIDALPECRFPPRGLPDGNGARCDPIAEALVAEGDAAVEPLIACYQNDSRMSRCMAPVYEQARGALQQILKSDWFGADPMTEEMNARRGEARGVLAQTMRAFWTKNRGVPLAERWYRTLKDDGAEPQEWATAADKLLTPDTEDAVVGGQMYLASWYASDPHAKGKPQGEPLRNRKDPGVSALLRKRLHALEAAGARRYGQNDPEAQKAQSRAQSAETLVEALASWEGKASADDIRTFQKCLTDGRMNAMNPIWSLANDIQAYEIRIRLGDKTALGDYTSWVKTADVEWASDGHDFVLMCRPMWLHPDDPRIIKLAEWMFADPHSPWHDGAGRPQDWPRGYAAEVLCSPLLGFEPFRRHVMALLDDKTPVAKLVIQKEGKLHRINPDGRTSDDGTFCPGDPKVPAPGTTVEFRKCDETAAALSAAEGFPQLQYYWQDSDRDAAIVGCKQILNRYGDRFRYNKDRPNWVYFGPEQTALVLPILNHPATPEDVIAGRAVFSLADEAKSHAVRVWPGFARPLMANWVTLKSHPRDDRHDRTDSNTGQMIETIDRSYEQGGTVYQAEEVQTEQGWRRFYGFVGKYDVAKVPAEEIEFPAYWTDRWQPLTGGIDCKLTRPGWEPGMELAPPLPISQPVKLNLCLWNRRGVAQSVPSQCVETSATGALSLRPGIKLSAAFTPRIPPYLNYPSYVPEEFGDKDWEPLAAKPTGRWPIETAGRAPPMRLLQPMEWFEVFSLDLRDCFDLSRPGAYWIRISFSATPDGLGSGISELVTFQIAPDQSKKQ